MGGLGVIVEYSSVTEVDDKLSCSGIYMSGGWVLTHGTIVIDILKSEKAGPLLEELKIKGCSFSGKNSSLQSLLENARSSFHVILDERNHRNLTQSTHNASVSCETLPECNTLMATKSLQLQNFTHHRRETKYDLQTPLALGCETTSYFCHPASVFMLFSQPGIIRSLSTMMPASQGWRLSEDKEGEDLDIGLEALIVSSFALLKISPQESNFGNLWNETSFKELRLLVEKILPFTDAAYKGSNVYIESSPFGSLSPSVFLNSLSKGIISNVAGFQKDMYLTDARCIMGAEGAPVYVTADKKVSLCGMVISPFCWKQGEWLGLSILAAVRPLLFSLLLSIRYYNQTEIWNTNSIMEKKESFSKTINKSRTSGESNTQGSLENTIYNSTTADLAKILDEVVVGISCDGGWGSGIVINSSPGIVLTCAHVIQPARSGVVEVITSAGIRIPGHVIYHTHPSCFTQQCKDDDDKQSASIWDLAVVTTSSVFSQALPLATKLPPKGSPVVVAGHGIFSPTCLFSPTLVHGIISKVISVDICTLRYTTPRVTKEEAFLCQSNTACDDSTSSNCSKICMNTHEKINIVRDASHADVCNNAELKSAGKQFFTSGLYSGMLNTDENGLVPVVMQTTCSVYAGNSGGPVVYLDPQHGLQVVGVMICNTKDIANKATFPNINLAVPSSAISNIIKAYLESGDKMLLNFLGVECTTASQLWTLGLTPQSQL